MPLIPLSDTQLYVQDTASDKPPIVFSHGLLWSHEMYRYTVSALEQDYRCIAYDHRGQGRSDKPKVRSISIERLTSDAIALLEHLNLGPVHFVGLSMGGFVGMRVAARRPDLVRSLVLISTAADPEPKENLGKYKLLNFVTGLFGVRPVTRSVMPIMFGKTFLTAPEHQDERQKWTRILQQNQRSITRAVRGVFERQGVTAELKQIQCPTLVLHGSEDEAISIPRADALTQQIPNATLVRTPHGGHSLPIETPEFIERELRTFFESLP